MAEKTQDVNPAETPNAEVMALTAQVAELQALVLRMMGEGKDSLPRSPDARPAGPLVLFHFDRRDLVFVEHGSPHERRLGAAGYVPVAEMASDGLHKVATTLELPIEGKPKLETLRRRVLAGCTERLARRGRRPFDTETAG